MGKRTRLCSMDVPLSDVWKAYESLNKSSSDTLRWLLDTYNASDANKKNAISVQKQHQGYRNKLTEIVGAKGGKFGDLELSKINRLMIRRYLDIATHKVGANRHVQYLKAAWNWGSQRYAQVPQANPCEKVTLNEETPRSRCPEEWEFVLVQDVIMQTTRSPYLAVMMEFAYLCRLRCIEVRNLKHSDIKDGCIRIVRTKGSAGELTRISPRLQSAIDMAKAIYPYAPSPITGAYLIHDAKGLKISKNKFDSAWQRVMKKASAVGLTVNNQQLVLTEPFRFHDIKAMGITDHELNSSGHLSEKSRKIYIRKLQEVNATR